MDWQALLAVAISATCGGWALWRFLRPLVRPDSHCDDCGHTAPSPLLQIEPAQAPPRTR